MSNKLWPSLTLGILITTGIASIWMVVAAWSFETYLRRTRGPSIYESLAVDASGQAWVQVNRIGANYLYAPEVLPYRTLDGDPIESPEHDYWISLSYLPSTEHYHSLGATGTRNGCTQVKRLGQTSRELWFLVHQAGGEDRNAYLVGYDFPTRQRVGYCGMSGFSTTLPDEDQRFPVDGRMLNHGLGGYAVNPSKDRLQFSIASSAGWFEFDVNQRELNAVDDSQACQSVNTCVIPDRLSQTLKEQLKEADYSSSVPTTQSAVAFVARLNDRIAVQDKRQDRIHEFAIPESARNRVINFYYISPDSAVLETYDGPGLQSESEVFWVNAAGEVQKQQVITWNRSSHEPPARVMSWLIAAMLPLPLAMAAMIFGLGPLATQMVEYPDWATAGYLERVGLILADFWPALAVLVLLSTGLAWFAMRRQREYSRPHPLAWATFIFLLGVPGFLTYWLCYPKPPLTTCRRCGEPAPRDRDSCSSCEQSFPVPALLGTEILA